MMFKLKVKVIFIAFILGYTPFLIAQNEISFSELEKLADSVMANYVKKSPAPDAVISILYKDSINFNKGYGWEDQAKTVSVNPNLTPFNLASVSKVFIAVSIMQLVDQGKLSLNDPVNKYLTDFKLDNDKITIWNLITHTSGLDHMENDSQLTNQPLMPMSEYFKENISKTVFIPGTQINYSNHAMALAAHIVELVSGLEFKNYIDQYIFGPLSMRNSSFAQPVPDHIGGEFSSERFDQFAWIRPYPAGSMVTTAKDINNFMSMLLNEGEFNGIQILSSKSVDQIFKRQFSQKHDMPGIGLGFFESELYGNQVFFHTGSKDHFAIMIIAPKLDLAMFMAIDADHSGSNLRYHLANKILKTYFNKDKEFVDQFKSNKKSINYEDFIGQYRFNLLAQNTFRKVMGLTSDMPISYANNILIADKRKKFKMFDKDLFRASDGAYVYFKRDDDGEVTHMFINSPLNDSISLKKLTWWETRSTHLIIIGFGVLNIIYSLIISLIMGYKRIFKKKQYFKNLAEKLLYYFNVVAAILFLASPITALIMVMNTENRTDIRANQIAEFAMLELKIASFFAFICILSLPIIILKRYWNFKLRTQFIIFSLAMIPFLWSMQYWNII